MAIFIHRKVSLESATEQSAANFNRRSKDGMEGGAPGGTRGGVEGSKRLLPNGHHHVAKEKGGESGRRRGNGQSSKLGFFFFVFYSVGLAL